MENLIRVTFVRVELPLHLIYPAFRTEVGRCASECRSPSSSPKKTFLSKIRFNSNAALFLGISSSSDMFTKTSKITGSDASDK